ncbi:kinase-like domain-containing protein [Fusarium oxysporum Fo47]|uniref:kinase-like domain-containing protein n=1 Tax=Fusarium oxysporum Fo47 TaxID=660027 RepID=UPI002869DAE6|nr:kinase-like domain-containing protein [Fusarium oxysporum Fo47]WJG35109.1 kinase-like domain-containing protein [Fusarium oxysporum Fo47]
MLGDSEITGLPGDRLKNQLEYALLPNGINQQEQFLPIGSLHSICNQAAVFTELSRYFDEEQAKQYTTYVCDQSKPARKIFTVLALINRIELVPTFQDAGFFDEDLPLTKNTENLELRSRRPEDQRSIPLTRSLQNVKMIRDFNVKQWCVHVPSFEKDVTRSYEDFVLESDTIMPWESSGQNIVTGGYGYVQKVKIHKDHHSFAEHKGFALKTILPAKERTRDVFKQELIAFRKVRPGPNLVELVSAFEISGKDQFMLLFPWADGGSMDDMMNQSSKNLFISLNLSSRDFVQWILSQCRGLVEALAAIHQVDVVPKSDEGSSTGQARNFGIHLDIKPTNILYFCQDTASHALGVLKIADFGLTKFHSLSSRTRKSRCTAYRCSQEYRSPEHDIGYIISRKVDTWALGCIFSEVFTWMLFEHEAREEFRRARTRDALKVEARLDESSSSTDSNKINQIQTPRLKPSVSQARKSFAAQFGMCLNKLTASKWIAKLGHEICRKNGPAFLTWVLEFIKDEMLHPEREDGADCERIVDYFDRFVNNRVYEDWDIDL